MLSINNSSTLDKKIFESNPMKMSPLVMKLVLPCSTSQTECPSTKLHNEKVLVHTCSYDTVIKTGLFMHIGIYHSSRNIMFPLFSAPELL